MNCVSCNSDTKVVASIATEKAVWRVRQCLNETCKWLVETKEATINESVVHSMRRARKLGKPIEAPSTTYFEEDDAT
jgi:hypothetical protein